MPIRIQNHAPNVSRLRRIGGGGQGEVYEFDAQWVYKQLLEHDPHTDQKLRKCVDLDLYRDASYFAAVPQELCHVHGDPAKPVVGYFMKNLCDGYASADHLTDKIYCRENKITLRGVVQFFAALHDVVTAVHKAGFIIGDFCGQNIMFKQVGNRFDIQLPDVDSWAVHMPHLGITYPCTAIRPGVTHPQLEDWMAQRPEAIRELRPLHDWFAFALLFAKALIKCDPFEFGYHPDFCGEERRRYALTCWEDQVELTAAEKRYANRFGETFTFAMRRALAGHDLVFDKCYIVNLLSNLIQCPNCHIEYHSNLGRCPGCSWN